MGCVIWTMVMGEGEMPFRAYQQPIWLNAFFLSFFTPRVSQVNSHLYRIRHSSVLTSAAWVFMSYPTVYTLN